jgi:hypothetical protein
MLGRLRLIAPHVTRELRELGLEVFDFGGHLVLPIDETAQAFRPIGGGVQLSDVSCHLVLLSAESFRAPQSVLHVTLQPFGTSLLEEFTGFPQSLERGLSTIRPAVTARGRSSHGVRGVAKSPRRLLQVGARSITRQPFELTCGLLDFFGEPPLRLRLPTGTGRSVLRPCAQAFVLLLLPPRQLAEPFQNLVHLFGILLSLSSIHFLVLIAESVGLQLEQIGQILRARGRASATAAPTALGDLAFPERRLGSLERLQRPLFRTQRILWTPLAKILLSLAHGLDRLWECFRDGREP